MYEIGLKPLIQTNEKIGLELLETLFDVEECYLVDKIFCDFDDEGLVKRLLRNLVERVQPNLTLMTILRAIDNGSTQVFSQFLTENVCIDFDRDKLLLHLREYINDQSCTIDALEIVSSILQKEDMVLEAQQ